MVSSGREIGAYLITVPILTVIGTVLNMSVTYALVRQGLRTNVAISIAVSFVSALLFFLIFVALRSGMTRAVSADGAIDLYDGARMGFGRAIATCFRKYAAFSGRASRSEYWFWVLFQFLMLVAAMVVDALAFRGSANVLSTLVWLGLLLPSLAVTVRRLHDTDMSGWWLFITLVPLIGSIALLIFLCSRGSEGPNRFGMGPASVSIPEVFA